MLYQLINACKILKTLLYLNFAIILLPLPVFAMDDFDTEQDYQDIINLCQDSADIGVHIFFPKTLTSTSILRDLSEHNILLSWSNSGDGDGRGTGDVLQVTCESNEKLQTLNKNSF
jgi:hypothetical protein